MVPVRRPLWLLGSRTMWCFQWRLSFAIFAGRSSWRSPEKQGANQSAHGWASNHGHFLTDRRATSAGKPGALRSGARALRSCRASSAGDAFWPKTRGSGNLVLSVRGASMDALVIPKPPSQTWTTRSRMRARPGQAATLMYACMHAPVIHILRWRNYATAARGKPKSLLDSSRRKRKSPCSGKRME